MKPKLTASEMGKRGAKAKRKKYGPDYWKRIRRGEKPSQGGKKS